MNEKAKYYTSYITDKGKRKLNEDSYLVIQKNNLLNNCILAMVADGVGGLKRSEIAANYLKESIEIWFKKNVNSFFVSSNEEIKEKLDDEIRNIHKFLLLNTQKSENPSEMTYGTTMTLLLIVNSKYIICHVGDTRCYISYLKTVKQLTKDQTEYQSIVDCSGKIPEDPQKLNRCKSNILQCIGRGKVKPHYYDGILPAEYNLLLCTDGFYRKLSSKEITVILNSTLDPYEKLKKTKDELRQRTESDDITAIIIKKVYEER